MLTIKALRARLLAPLDPTLFNASALLMAMGLVVLYSATGSDLAKVVSQVRNLGFAFVAMWVIAVIPVSYTHLTLPTNREV